MKNYRNIIFASVLSAVALGTTSCRDDFSDINTNPSQITKADPSYLFAQSVMNFDPYDYTYWFYDAPMLYSWTQLAVPTGSMSSSFKVTTTTGGVDYVNTLKYVHEVAYVREKMSVEDADKHAATAACMNVVTAYLALNAADINGDIPFTEAGQALHGGTLTPAYDRVADLYTLWLSQMDEAIATFTTATNQTFPANQDIVYRGDLKKWAKLANSFKLRIAARLISQDKARAIKIAEEVGNASCGYINTLDECMLFNKGVVNSSSNDFIYHWSNGFMEGNASSQRVVDFMVQNQDPQIGRAHV